MRIALNSAPMSLFEGTDERSNLIACGRMLMAEANGKATNRVRKNNEYTERMNANDYATMNEKTKQAVIMFCAGKAASYDGREKPENYEGFLSRSRDYYKNQVFIHTLSGIVEDIVRPMLPYVISNAMGELGQFVNVPHGQTYEIEVMSNDIFLFQDTSWGATRSVPENTLYNKSITLNPQPIAASATAKWYQLVGNGADFGLWLNAIAAGLYSKIMGKWYSALYAASTNTLYTPSYLQFNSFSSANLNAAAEYVSAVNGVPVSSLMLFGRRTKLATVLPTGTAQDAALTYGLGVEWMNNGYLGTVQGIPTFEMQNAIVPGTQNTTGALMINDTYLYLAARGGNGGAPIYVGMEEGTPMTLEFVPQDTADMSMNVHVISALDVKPVFGSKIAVIKG